MDLTKHTTTLKEIRKLLGNIKWRLVGSTNLALQGVNIDAGDVDLQIPSESVETVNELLSNYVINPIVDSENEKYRSYFGQFKINNILVEIMTKNVLKTGEDKKNNYEDISIQIGDIVIACASLQEEYDVAVVRNQNAKADAILNMLSKKL